jgi:YHS domain-containing protein
VVVSGNFLLDSESRMRTAGSWPADVGAGVEAEPAGFKDPVCGMAVDEAEARQAGLVSEQDGVEFLFCCESCKERFDADPAAFLASAPPQD